MRIVGTAIALFTAAPILAHTQPQRPVRIITADQASSCEYVNIVSAMKFAALRGASRSAQAAMETALHKAAEAECRYYH